jgi:hypothetical protein
LLIKNKEHHNDSQQNVTNISNGNTKIADLHRQLAVLNNRKGLFDPAWLDSKLGEIYRTLQLLFTIFSMFIFLQS